MTRIAQHIHARIATVLATRHDAGVGTVEVAIIASALAALALGVIAVITGFIDEQMSFFNG